MLSNHKFYIYFDVLASRRKNNNAKCDNMSFDYAQEGEIIRKVVSFFLIFEM